MFVLIGVAGGSDGGVGDVGGWKCCNSMPGMSLCVVIFSCISLALRKRPMVF